MVINKIEIQDHEGNVYHPHTTGEVVFIKDAENLFTSDKVEYALAEVMEKANDNERSILLLNESVNGAKSKLATEQDKFVDLIY